jgi:hypothetical protein
MDPGPRIRMSCDAGALGKYKKQRTNVVHQLNGIGMHIIEESGMACVTPSKNNFTMPR